MVYYYYMLFQCKQYIYIYILPCLVNINFYYFYPSVIQPLAYEPICSCIARPKYNAIPIFIGSGQIYKR